MHLCAETLTCTRGGRMVFVDLSFSLGAGEAMVVTGRNGAGKSSLLRTIAGLLRPAAGRIALDGGDPERSLGEQAHYLGHQDALKSSLSVSENLDFWTRYLGGGGIEPMAALQAVGLAAVAHLPAGYLSAGQRRRLSLARLAAVKRPVWLLDEPSAALDANGQVRLADLVRAHRQAGGLVVAATHGPLPLGGATELRLGEDA